MSEETVQNGLNHVTLVGDLVDTPTVKELDSGRVCNFMIEVPESYTSREGEAKEFRGKHFCVAWNKAADKIGQFKAGDRVLVMGKITSRGYEKDGVKRYVTEIKVHTVVACSFAPEGDDNGVGF